MEIKAKSAKPDDLRAYLLDERVRLKTGMEREDISGREQAGYGNHIADDATEVFEQTKQLALWRGLEKHLSEVQDALRKLDNGTYGDCEACGRSIDPARLKAIPSAGLCFSCQVHAEERKGTSWRRTR